MSERDELGGNLMAGEEVSERPNLTKWDVVRSCGCCGPLVKIEGPKGTHYFLRHWKCNPGAPIGVTIMVLLCLAIHCGVVCPLSPVYLVIPSVVVIVFFAAMFMWSYFGAVCMDPGFLPFNWIETRRFWYSWEEQLSGLAATEEQVLWARQPEHRPPGCSFSATSGRYVMRADHICGWIANWVGKRNHKQFMLMNFWGALYAFALFGFMFGQNIEFWDIPLPGLVLELLAGIIELTFGFVMAGMGIGALVDIAKRRTKLQRMRHEKGDSKKVTCEQSMREVCGDGSKCGWFWPTPAFDKSFVMSTEEEPAEDASE